MPSQSASVLVAFAGTGGTPVKSKVGNDMKLPPPATALSALAMPPTAQSSSPCRMSKRSFYHERMRADQLSGTAALTTFVLALMLP